MKKINHKNKVKIAMKALILRYINARRDGEDLDDEFADKIVKEIKASLVLQKKITPEEANWIE